MNLKFTVISKLSTRSDLCYSFWDFLDVLNHLPDDDDHFVVAIVSCNNLYCFDYFTGSQKANSLFNLIDFVKTIQNGDF